MNQWILFLIGSIIIAYFSRASLLVTQSHGFSRFFAWELILIMVIWNLQDWFADPFSLHQLISWILLSVSIVLLVQGIYLLRNVGKTDAQRPQDVPLLGIEKTSALVTVGVYKYIRHPLYSSLLSLAWGVFFKSPSWLDGFLAALASGFLLRTAKVEEKECLRFFGLAYQDYMKQTKMFIPFLF